MSTTYTFTRTRIAPTPSGYLHIGNVLSFALTAGLARRYEAKIWLRIDDLDRPRVKREYVEDIFDTLRFLEIPWDEGPEDYLDYEAHHSQVHRLAHYQEVFEQLKAAGKVFSCICSRSDIQRLGTGGVYPGICLDLDPSFKTGVHQWRLDTSEERQLTVHDILGYKHTHLLPPLVDYFVVLKKDGVPAYQLTSLTDDIDNGVDFIVRGGDLWDSTLAQQYLADVLGLAQFSTIHFCHHGLVTNQDGGKLSKSAGDTAIRQLRENGMSSVDVYQLLGRAMGLKEHIGDWKSLTDAAYPMR